MVNIMTTRTILDVKAPKERCEDKNCPFHGTLKVRGKTFTGMIISDNMQGSVIVQWTGSRKVPKYERYEKTRTKIAAHNPKCVDARKGDIVKIGECRPLSKTKTFVVLGVVGKESVKEKVKKEGVEEGKKERLEPKSEPKSESKSESKSEPGTEVKAEEKSED